MPPKPKTMPPTLSEELAVLDWMITRALRGKDSAVFEEPTTAGNRA